MTILKKLFFLWLMVIVQASVMPKSNAGVTVELKPAKLILSETDYAGATLAVRNDGPAAIKNVRVESQLFPGLTVQISSPKTLPGSILPDSIGTWDVKMKLTCSSEISGNVIFQVSYDKIGEKGSESKGIAFAELTVENNYRKYAERGIEVNVLTSLKDLKDFRPGYIYLQVKNDSAAPVAITNIIAAERPKFVVLRSAWDQEDTIPAKRSAIPFPDKQKRIAPGASGVFPIHVSAEDKILPGKHLLIFNVFYTKVINGATLTGSTIVEHELEVKVFGEGEVLGAFANISSFLILPGFLILLSFRMSWKLLKHLHQKAELNMDLKDPTFWALAIPLSLLMASIGYPLLTSLLPFIGQRDILSGYNFYDIFWMWSFSIVIGLIAAVSAARFFWHRKKKQMEKLAREVDVLDPPMVLLQKLVFKEIKHTKFDLIALKSSKKKAFLLFDKKIDNQKKCFLSPTIEIVCFDEDNGFREKLGTFINDNNLADTVETLKEGIKSGEKIGKGISGVNWTEYPEPMIRKPEFADYSELDEGYSKKNGYLFHLS